MSDGILLVILTIIGILVLAAVQTEGYGRSENKTLYAVGVRSDRKAVSTVVGGTRADRDEYPWQVLLYYGTKYQCGGSILNEWTGMTVAHCIIKDETQKRYRYSIVAGERNRYNSNGKEQIIKVKTVVKHVGFNSSTFENDIALLHLEAPLKFKRSVQPVSLTDTDFEQRDIITGNCFATGYGLIKPLPSNRLSKHLQEIQVKVISNAKCNRRLKQYGDRTERSMMCSYDEGVGVCQGDSGGPLGCFDRNGNYRQVGMVSWVPTSNCLIPPSVYTRVEFFLDWINSNMYQGTGF